LYVSFLDFDRAEPVIYIPTTLIETKSVNLSEYEGRDLDGFFKEHGLPTGDSEEELENRQYWTNAMIVQKLTAAAGNLDDIFAEDLTVGVPASWVDTKIGEFETNCEMEIKDYLTEIDNEINSQTQWDEGWYRLLDDSDYMGAQINNLANRFMPPSVFFFFVEFEIAAGLDKNLGAGLKFQTGFVRGPNGCGYYRMYHGSEEGYWLGQDKNGDAYFLTLEGSAVFGAKYVIADAIPIAFKGHEISISGKDISDIKKSVLVPEFGPAALLGPSWSPGYSINDMSEEGTPIGGTLTWGFSIGTSAAKRTSTIVSPAFLMTYTELAELTKKLNAFDHFSLLFCAFELKNRMFVRNYRASEKWLQDLEMADLYINGKDMDIKIFRRMNNPNFEKVWFTENYYIKTREKW